MVIDYLYVSLVFVRYVEATLSKTNLLLSLKWVEAPGYGGGGPNWVEVCHKQDNAAGS